MKFNLTRFTSAKVYRKLTDPTVKIRGFFWVNKSNYRYDEYANMYPNPALQYYQYQAPVVPLGYIGPYPFHEIAGSVVTHDIGDGENDFILDKVVFDAQYDTKNYRQYTYNVNKADPTLVIELRNTSYQNETPTLTYNAIALNNAAVPGLNPWVSRSNTPGGTTISSNDVAATRESLALVVPFSKYRRLRIYATTIQKMTTIRSIQVYSTEFVRRTYG